MPQAMDRLLASPKMTAVFPFRSIMRACSLRAPNASSAALKPFPRISAAQIDQVDVSHGLAKEARPKPFEFLHRIRRETTDCGCGAFSTSVGLCPMVD